ncbi:MAG TPA: hypothetical protein VFI73_00465 [Candidatus Nitrosopolaris sp.]|nr:hypothetical protein [Candidatus Nitrosopolaris sp.]
MVNYKLYELTRHTPKQNAAITGGLVPYAIGVYLYKVYAANRMENTVSH